MSTDNPTFHATAVIAEDEPLLAQALIKELHTVWPGLTVVAEARDGEEALERALALLPQVVFLDIRMPGRDGLDAAQAIVDAWPPATPLPLIVFVTAYDEYALKAFEASAADYLLKPVQTQRLAAACSRLRTRLAASNQQGLANDEQLLAQLRTLVSSSAPAREAPLEVITAAQGSITHVVPVAEVLYFEAADKYVRVVTATSEHLIRTSLRELLPQLDAQRFWQIHRGTVVRATAVARAERDELGRVQLKLHDRPERLPVSRLYAPRFKGL